MTRGIMTLERLFNPVGGNPNGGRGSIDWMTQNFCAECSHITFKGTTLCPRCHGRVRICPRKGNKQKVYKKLQTEAARKLKATGWKLPPPTIGARTMFPLSHDFQ